MQELIDLFSRNQRQLAKQVFVCCMIFKLISAKAETLQNFTFMGAMVFEIAGGRMARPPSVLGKRCGYQKAWKRKG